jgi:hypothetical protein
LFPVPKGLRLTILLWCNFDVCLKLFPVPKGLRPTNSLSIPRLSSFEIVPCTEGIEEIKLEERLVGINKFEGW